MRAEPPASSAMKPALKTRLIGAAVLIALAVIIVPLFFSGKPQGAGKQGISLDIPEAPDRNLETRTMSVAPPARGRGAETDGGDEAGPAAAGTAVGTAVGSGQLATVDTDTSAGGEKPSRHKQEAPTAALSAATSTEANAQADAQANAPHTAPSATSRPGRAANAHFRLSLGAYASKSNAKKVMQQAREHGYDVDATRVSVNDKPAARVVAGPFDTRAAAESARVKLHDAMPQATVKILADASDQTSDATSDAAAGGDDTNHPTEGWAVQVVAYSKRSDAVELRDKLRDSDLDAYVDGVTANGNKLWRVRVGPHTRRRDAMALKKRIENDFDGLQGRVVKVP